MATLEELVVKITADTKDAVNKIETFGSKMKNIGDGVAKVTTPLAAMGTAVVAGLSGLIMKAANTGDALADMSRRTGIASEDLSRLKFAAEISGTTIEGVETSLKFLTRVMDDAQKGTGSAKDTFEKLGITVTDTNGKLKPITEVLIDAADKISKMDNSAEQAALTMELFGARAGTELLPLLKQGGDGISDLMKKADDLGITISSKTATAADDFMDRLTELKGSISGVTTTIGTALMPIIVDLIETHIKPLIEKIKQIPLETLKDNFEKLIPVLEFLVGAMVLGKLVSIFSQLASPTGLIMLLVGAIIVLVQNWDKVKAGFERFYERYIAPWYEPLKKALEWLWDKIVKIADFLGKHLGGKSEITVTTRQVAEQKTGFENSVVFGGGFASGGSFIVKRPTLFLAGERGTEYVSVTPQGKDENTPLFKEMLKELRKFNEITAPALSRQISLSVSGLGGKV
ncbi:MAG: phage tail tape measure protein [Ignavibacteriales bacterium]|nr:phage tail tape measure protein [Ignavibacteriales bacterium]